ncbi:hypothetical protein B879_03680 [Cecembia lonarensis LW9]|uniref:Uncharacterized protein n=1 Tax=Cecembia lonarensis (strain CCUG 58316 / KCTC 22772 / LW9) TaxID=1225176 RepID=K1LUC4_CECL9|nr:hypothetical protein B879_03680 [Cecembia lonarensis LW9]
MASFKKEISVLVFIFLVLDYRVKSNLARGLKHLKTSV